ncbi:type I-F CRISPR-associated endoribonuclease Cas6/Csy4 [Lampropedia puyangensis]|nr:type I-F CRISPR-associated endoribonuclease Cas6/Csy4 [Lampropedia puyangensis]
MIDHYLDIQVHPSSELQTNTLMAQLFSKVHVWLAAHGQGRMGVSFPNMQLTPGDVLRMHGSAADLTRFVGADWRQNLALWTSIGAIAAVPDGARHVRVMRVQRKSAHNMRQRAMRRHGLSLEEATARIPDQPRFYSKLPYLIIKSSSTGQRLSLYLQQEAIATATPGGFSAYGLSQQGATVPWFPCAASSAAQL